MILCKLLYYRYLDLTRHRQIALFGHLIYASLILISTRMNLTPLACAPKFQSGSQSLIVSCGHFSSGHPEVSSPGGDGTNQSNNVRMGEQDMRMKLLAAAIGAAALGSGSNAKAADLGGNCCADLEERVAELEATAARKGNRKVSLTITGWVQSQLFWFDDGVESNVYVVDTETDLSSNVKFTGSAEISPGWKAGYALQLNNLGTTSFLASNERTTRGSLPIQVDFSYWFIQSDTLGKLSVGKQSLSADNAVITTDFSGTLFPANNVTFDGAFLRLAVNGAYLPGLPTWQETTFWCEGVGVGIGSDCAGGRLNGVRYDTPTFAGFTLSGSWGEDDYWDVTLRYAGEFSGFKMAFATSYAEMTDENILGVGIEKQNDNQYFQVGGMVKHLASGLWIHGTWAQNSIDDGPNHRPVPDNVHWYVKAGWTTKFSSLGNTNFYGEFSNYADGFRSGVLINGALLADSSADRWGIGAVQEIDAAAMSLFAKWRRHEGEVTDVNGVTTNFDDVDMFLAGAVIFY